VLSSAGLPAGKPMDFRIILSAFCSFLAYLFIHTLIFRVIDQKKVLVWIVNTCLLGGLFPEIFALISAWLFPLPGETFLIQFSAVSLLSFILYGLLAVLYILGPFGLIESSLRLKLLNEIAGAGNRGISRPSLYKLYNRHAIIRKRLDRFVTAKDFKYQNGNYYIRNRFSYFLIQAFLFENMKRIYLSGSQRTENER
jgi:hypothetical protein